MVWPHAKQLHVPVHWVTFPPIAHHILLILHLRDAFDLQTNFSIGAPTYFKCRLLRMGEWTAPLLPTKVCVCVSGLVHSAVSSPSSSPGEKISAQKQEAGHSEWPAMVFREVTNPPFLS